MTRGRSVRRQGLSFSGGDSSCGITSLRRLNRGIRVRSGKRLLEIGDDVAYVLDADRKPDHLGRNAGLALLFGGHLAVRGRSGVTRKRLRVADIDEPLDQLQRVVKRTARGKSALDA